MPPFINNGFLNFPQIPPNFGMGPMMRPRNNELVNPFFSGFNQMINPRQNNFVNNLNNFPPFAPHRNNFQNDGPVVGPRPDHFKQNENKNFNQEVDN